VLVALLLITTDFIAQLLIKRSDSPLLPLFAVAIVITAFFGLWVLGLYRRLNWLRWVTVGCAVIGLLSLPFTGSMALATVPLSLLIVKYSLFDMGALLLCFPHVRRGFPGALTALPRTASNRFAQ
jgi:hypothetical protein